MNNNPTKAELTDACILLEMMMAENVADIGHYLRPYPEAEKDRLIVALLVMARVIAEKPVGLPLGKLLEMLREEGSD